MREGILKILGALPVVITCMVLAPALKAQAIVCDKQPNPNVCVNQPVEGDTQIQGYVSAPGKGVAIHVTIDGNPPIVLSPDQTNGTFKIAKIDNALSRHMIVSVVDLGVATFSVPVLFFCGPHVNSMDDACLVQPSDAAKAITGHAPPGKNVSVKIGEKQTNVTGTSDKKGRFIVQAGYLSAGDWLDISFDGGANFTGPYPILASKQAGAKSPSCQNSTNAPCLAQPVAGASQTVKGYAVPGSTVAIQVNGTAEGTASVNPDGSFSKAVPTLNQGDSVEADVTGPTVTSALGPINVPAAVPAAPPALICTGAPPKTPCFSQPGVGDTAVKGVATSGDAVTIKINGSKSYSALVSADGSFTSETVVPALKAGDNIDAQVSTPGVAKPIAQAVAPATPPAPGATSSLYTLGMVGLNATGSGSSGPNQQYFAEFDLMAPLPWLGSACPRGKSSYPLSQKCWVWFNPRIASIPSPSSSAISSLGSPSSLTTGVSGQTIGQITQTFEFQSGLEYHFRQPWFGRQFGFKSSWARISSAAIAGGGMVTPFNPTTGAPEFSLNGNLGQQFAQSATLTTQYPVLASGLCDGYGLSTGTPTGLTCPASSPTTKPTTVAFLYPNRSRFYRDFYGGFRLRTFFLSGDCPDPSESVQPNEPTASCQVQNIYPGTFDFRFGEDETVTAGRLVPIVMTFVGNYPLPGTDGAVRIFGSAYLRLRRNQNTPALVLVPTSTFTALSDPTVVVQPIQPSDQDYFRLGLAVDLIALIGRWMSPAASKSSGTQ